MARMLVVRQAVKIVPSSVMLLGAAVTSLTLWRCLSAGGFSMHNVALRHNAYENVPDSPCTNGLRQDLVKVARAWSSACLWYRNLRSCCASTSTS